MIVKQLTLQNIRSYEDATINFPQGSTLLMGDIGSGKTSILLALEFALFGLQPSQKGSSLVRNNKEEAFVRLEFEIDNKEIVIERKIKKGGKSFCQTDASVTINNEKHEGSVSEIKDKILELLNYPIEFRKKTNDLYKFTVYTPQEEMKQIILEPSETRLNTLRHIFGIDKYKRISENLSTLGTKLRQEIRVKEAKLEDINQLKTDIENKKQRLAIKEKETNELEIKIQEIKDKKETNENEIKELESKIQEKNNLTNEKSKSEVMLSSKKDILQNYEKEILLLKEKIEEGKKFQFNEQEFTSIQTRITSQEQFLRQNSEELLAINSKIHSLQSKKIEANSLKNKITGLEKCPTCLQEVNQEYKNNIISNANSEVMSIDSQTQDLSFKKIELEKKQEQIKKQIDVYKNSLSDIQILKIKLQGLKEKETKVQEIEKSKLTIIKDITMFKSQIEKLNSSIQEFEKITPIYEEKKQELNQINSKLQELLINKAEINKEIQLLNQQTQELEEKIKTLENLKIKINEIKELESWLSNKFSQFILHTEKNVMLTLREEFSELFSQWFSMLVPEDLSVRLDETFSPIINQKDYELDYAFLSGGEKTAVALAYRLALNQVINSLLSKIKTHDIVILDEPTDGFSETQLDKMRDVFQELKVKQLILVSHEQKIEGFVDNIIRMSKESGVSTIQE